MGPNGLIEGGALNAWKRAIRPVPKYIVVITIRGFSSPAEVVLVHEEMTMNGDEQHMQSAPRLGYKGVISMHKLDQIDA
jgi:hypothetical protein